jgi:hypothetical protein
MPAPTAVRLAYTDSRRASPSPAAWLRATASAAPAANVQQPKCQQTDNDGAAESPSAWGGGTHRKTIGTSSRTASPADSAALQDRASEAIHWHLEHTQPDNSTNRPWALHAFLLADRPGGIGAGDASLYAETLLHNMGATDARNEPLSRWILADAARELRLATAT